jgi:hypothetical protein
MSDKLVSEMTDAEIRAMCGAGREPNKPMDAIERIAREAGTYESTLTYLAGLVEEEHLTDAEFRSIVRRELTRNDHRIAELRAEGVTRVAPDGKKRPQTVRSGGASTFG